MIATTWEGSLLAAVEREVDQKLTTTIRSIYDSSRPETRVMLDQLWEEVQQSEILNPNPFKTRRPEFLQAMEGFFRTQLFHEAYEMLKNSGVQLSTVLDIMCSKIKLFRLLPKASALHNLINVDGTGRDLNVILQPLMVDNMKALCDLAVSGETVFSLANGGATTGIMGLATRCYQEALRNHPHRIGKGMIFLVPLKFEGHTTEPPQEILDYEGLVSPKLQGLALRTAYLHYLATHCEEPRYRLRIVGPGGHGSLEELQRDLVEMQMSKYVRGMHMPGRQTPIFIYDPNTGVKVAEGSQSEKRITALLRSIGTALNIKRLKNEQEIRAAVRRARLTETVSIYGNIQNLFEVLSSVGTINPRDFENVFFIREDPDNRRGIPSLKRPKEVAEFIISTTLAMNGVH